MSDDTNWALSRRKLLGSAAVLGGAGALGGAATTSLLWDEEKFGNSSDPNVLQGGRLDLKVDWEGTYYDWIDNPTFMSDDPSDNIDGVDPDGEPDEVDQPGPIINLTDVKPGDVLEVTLSAHIYGNPAFLGGHYQEHADSDGDDTDGDGENDDMPEPEDKVNGEPADQSDGTDDGDLDEYMQVVMWYDDGDNLADEFSDTLGLQIDDDDDGSLDDKDGDGSTADDLEDYVMALTEIKDASPLQDLDPVIYAGTLANIPPDVRFRADKSRSTDTNEPTDGTDDDGDLVAEDFTGAGGEGYCYEASATEYIGVLAWVPWDIEGVNDNIIQTDRLEFQFGFDAIQCRHNVGNDGLPLAETLAEADADNNAQGPEGAGGGT